MVVADDAGWVGVYEPFSEPDRLRPVTTAGTHRGTTMGCEEVSHADVGNSHVVVAAGGIGEIEVRTALASMCPKCGPS